MNAIEQQNLKTYMRLPYSVLGIFVAMVVQTFGAGWWASSMSTKIDYLQTQVTTLTSTNNNNSKDHYILEDNSKRLDKIEDILAKKNWKW